MRNTPQIISRDGYSLGQLAKQWDRSTHFVRGLVGQGLLHPNERGVVTNDELHRFYQESGTLLDA